MRYLFLSLLLAALVAPGAHATLDEAQDAYDRGDFVTAGELAREHDGIQAKTLAAQAYLAEAGYVANGGDARKWLTESVALAKEALAKDPDHVEAILYRVIAMGYEGRVLGNWSAHNEGLGREAKALITHAMELEPENPWVHMVYGGWHAEIVDGAGAFMGSLLYGAKTKTAIKSSKKAVTLAPDEPVFRVEYARSLLRLSFSKYTEEVTEQLTLALAIKPTNAFEEIILDHGRQLLAALETKDKKTIKRVFVTLDAFRDPQ